MEMDYQANSRKSKEDKPKPEKKIEKVVAGEVVVHKKSLGTKIKNMIIEADFKTVIRTVVSNVLVPAARNMVSDAFHEAVDRTIYGEAAVRHRRHGPGSRVTYNNPISRPYSSDPRDPRRMAPSVEPGPRRSRQRGADFILSSKEEAQLVLERMNDIIDTYDVVSIADLNELVGFPTSHVDNKWGWVFLGDVDIRQLREGYLIDLPPAEPIQ